MRPDEQSRHNATQPSQRSFEFDDISHDRACAFDSESVVMHKALENSLQHRVLKVGWRLTRRYLACVRKLQAEVPCTECHCLTDADESVRSASDRHLLAT